MARAKAYPHAKFRLDASNRLATVHQRHWAMLGLVGLRLVLGLVELGLCLGSLRRLLPKWFVAECLATVLKLLFLIHVFNMSQQQCCQLNHSKNIFLQINNRPSIKFCHCSDMLWPGVNLSVTAAEHIE